MKRIVCVFLIFFLLVGSVFASSPRVWDQEALLSHTEEGKLQALLDEVSCQYGVDLVVVTARDFGGKSAQAYADDFYDQNGYGDDGVLLLVSMERREYHISTAGSCIAAFNDSDLDDLEEDIIPYLQRGDVYGAYAAFAQRCHQVLGDYEQAQKDLVWQIPLICLAIGAVVALIVVLILRSQLRSVRSKHQAGDYVRPGSLHMTQCMDLFLYHTTRRTAKPQNNSHTSVSGRSHGGRGGRF